MPSHILPCTPDADRSGETEPVFCYDERRVSLLLQESEDVLRELVGDPQGSDARLDENLVFGQIRGFLRKVGIANLAFRRGQGLQSIV